MKYSVIALALLFFAPLAIQAQTQTADEEGYTQAGFIRRIDKDADYGAYLVNKQFDFAVAKGIDKMPVVAASEKGDVEMVSTEDNTEIGYLLPYNNFMVVDDYDFEVLNKGKFKSQKYPPARISLSSDEVFIDDNYGLFYGFTAQEQGQRCRFTYNYRYTDAKYLTRVFFHQSIAVKNMSVSFRVPSWLKLDIKEMNFAGYTITKTVKEDKNGISVITYTANDLPSIKQEPSSLARPFYLPHLVITVQQFTADKKDYNGFNTLDDVYAWYNYLYKNAKNDDSPLKATVARLTEGKTSDEDKVKSIYYWVQDNIRYIAYEEGYAGFIPQTVQEVYKNKYGDCKGMANLLTEMLKLAGFDAHFAWIGTKDIPYDIKDVKSLCAANHAISVLYLKGKTYFIDGTEKYGAFGTDAYRIQGKTVLVQNGDTYKTEKVPDAKIDDNQIITKATLKLDNGKITGHIALTFNGSAKSLFHYVYNNIPAEKRKDFIKSLLEIKENNTDVSNVSVTDFRNRDIPLKLEGDVVVENEITSTDSFAYFGIDFFPATITGFYPGKDRQTPFDMDALFSTNDEVVLTIPGASKVKSLPKPLAAKYKDNVAEASYQQNGNTITLSKKLEMADPVIYPKDFQAWKDFLNQIKEYNRNSISIETK
ncbi:MAG TPA: transglutaminase-like domain-containing protein [Panacibacter sp.]|nr:transglutaminase-like domain-containing protein [Panacibacter sp.]HNP43516.1 transglutaminase-like domain-containing protein [Panacibacter sp.]